MDLMETKYTLSNMEQVIVKLVAEIRQTKNRNGGTTNQIVTKDDPLTLDIVGFGGEVAFARMFNCYPDFTTHIRVGGHDAITRKGYKVDIKTTRGNPPCLRVKGNKDGEGVDVYVLMHCNWPHFECIGYVYKEEILRPEYLSNYKGEEWYSIPKDKLRTEWV
jgi:hypothetical protein